MGGIVLDTGIKYRGYYLRHWDKVWWLLSQYTGKCALILRLGFVGIHLFLC